MHCTSSDLHVAIYASNLRTIKECVQNKNIINSYWRGCTPVSSAIYLKRYEILEILVSNGANVNLISRNNKMEPPLFAACRLQDYTALNILLNSPNLDIDQRDFFARTALWAAARYCKADVVELLLNRGATLNDNHSVRHPLNAAFEQNRKSARSVIELLVRRGSLLELCDESPLKWAVKHADKEIFCLLVSAGCRVTSEDEDWLSNDKLPRTWQDDLSFCNWIESLKRNPIPLLHLTSCFIRNILSKNWNGVKPCHVKKLGLPESLNSLILLNG